MSVIFISHSSRNNDDAVALRDWLHERGWSEIFLDLDPDDGLAPGQRWREELRRAGEECVAVILLISPDWAGSKWCLTEFMVAAQLGKCIFPLVIAPTAMSELPAELTADFQLLDLSTPEARAEGFDRLATGIRRAGLDPRHFPWPPPEDPRRSPYRGLHALEEMDAAIFFGRDAAITRGLDSLRRMRSGRAERILTIVGASGAGKSSFLRAGLLARLHRDSESFVPLPVVRPERAALTGPCGLLAALGLEPGAKREALVARLGAIRHEASERAERYATVVADARLRARPTIVIPIDQGEELFQAGHTEADDAIAWLARIVEADRDTLIVVTIRSDSLHRLQAAHTLAGAGLQLFNLPALAPGAFKDVIRGPAGLSEPPLEVEDALVDRLISDLDRADALPLLAFTMQRLYESRDDEGSLRLSAYTDKLGGLAGAIDQAVEAAFEAARRDPALPNDFVELYAVARRAFIPWLVQIDDADAAPKRRLARLAELDDAAALVAHLVDQRLLQTSTREGVAVVEVAHEAILRNWRPLALWIAEERERLRTLNAVQEASRDWHAHRQTGDDRAEAWLVHTDHRLDAAEALRARDDYARLLGEEGRDYLAACRALERAREAHERSMRARRTFWQRIATATLAATVLVAVAGLVTVLRAQRDLSRQVSRSVAEHGDAQWRDYRHDRAMRLALIASREDLQHAASTDAEVVLGRAAHESRLEAQLVGHEDFLFDVAFAPGGDALVTASADHTARVWRRDDTGAWVSEVLSGHGDAVLSAAFSPDGRRIVTTSDDATARVWVRDESGAWMGAALAGHSEPVLDAAFSPDGSRIVTASEDNTARVWHEDGSGWSASVLSGHAATVLSATFADNAVVVTGSDDRTARLWSESGDGTWTAVVLAGHDRPVVAALPVPGAGPVVTASWDRTARVWRERAAGEWSSTPLVGHAGSLLSLAVAADGMQIVTGSRDGEARLWRYVAGAGWKPLVLSGHAGPVGVVALSPRGSQVLTAADDATARLWVEDPPGEWTALVLAGHEGPVSAADFSPDATHVVTASDDYTARVWRVDAPAGSSSVLAARHDGAVMSVGFSGDGSAVITACLDGSARVWHESDGRWTAQTLAGHESEVQSAAFSPAGDYIVTAAADQTAHIWQRSQTGWVASATLEGHTDLVSSAAFAPDGTRIVTASWDNTVRIWRADNQGRWRSMALEGHGQLVLSAAFSHDGTRIVTASKDGTARVWQPDAGGVWSSIALRGHNGWVTSASFAPDNRRIVTSSHDGTARVWHEDAVGDWSSTVLAGHGGEVLSAAFSADGARVVTGSADRTVRVWRPSDQGRWTSIALSGHADAVKAVSFAPGGRRIVSGSLDGSMRVWDLPWLMTSAERERSGLAPLTSAVCRAKLVVSDAGGSGVSVRRLSVADTEAAPILRGREGEEVCGRY